MQRTDPGRLFEVTADGQPLLRVRGGMFPTAADARLIAAAPELLEACKDALYDRECELADCESPGTRQTLEMQIATLRRAIAKATWGES